MCLVVREKMFDNPYYVKSHMLAENNIYWIIRYCRCLS